MTYQVALRLRTSPHIKAEQGNPTGGEESQHQAEESETALALSLRSCTEHQAT